MTRLLGKHSCCPSCHLSADLREIFLKKQLNVFYDRSTRFMVEYIWVRDIICRAFKCSPCSPRVFHSRDLKCSRIKPCFQIDSHGKLDWDGSCLTQVSLPKASKQ